MPGTHDARDRLLVATLELLREGGETAATPAAVADRAGAGKMSVYRHFAGKDELIATALDERDAAHRAWLLGPGTDAPLDRLLGMFDRVAGRAARPGYSACPFVTTRLEVHDAQHPAAAIARRHKTEMVKSLAAIVAELGAPAPEHTAKLILMLLDGAGAHAVVHGDASPILEARAAVAAMAAQWLV